MDSENEIARAKWLLLGLVLFLVSAFISYRELVYLLRGRDVQATVVKAYEVERRGRFGLSAGTQLVIDYEFTDADGHRRKGYGNASSDRPVSEGGTIAVRYTPGADGSSRLVGQVNWVGLALFAAAVVYVSVVGVRFWQHVSEAVNDKKPPRRR